MSRDHPSEDFVTPSRIEKKLRPRSGFTSAGRAARVQLIKEVGARKVEPSRLEATRLFSIVYRADFGESEQRLVQRAKEAKQQLTWRDLVTARVNAKPLLEPTQIPFPFPLPEPPSPEDLIPKVPWPPRRDIWFERLQELTHPAGPHVVGCYPDLYEVTPWELCPGDGTSLYGTCFGDTAGSVLMEIAPGELVVPLQIGTWSSTYVQAWLSPDLTGLRPHQGAIWVVTTTGDASNTYPARFRPGRALFIAFAGFGVQAGALGYPVTEWPVNDPENLEVLSGQTLGDTEFQITNVQRFHEGGGHSELVAPFASGQSLAQGVHVGLAAYEQATIEVMYTCRGPRGLTPPPIPGLGVWGFLGDSGC